MPTPKTEAIQGAFDTMAAGIADRKADRATALTPVGIEGGGPLDAAEAKGMLILLHGVQDSLMMLMAITDRLEKTIVDASLAGKLPERKTVMNVTEAQRPPVIIDEAGSATLDEVKDFVQTFAAKAAAAQAAVFSDAPSVREPDVWACPDHGTDNVVTLVSRKGRNYGSCTICGKHEAPK